MAHGLRMHLVSAKGTNSNLTELASISECLPLNADKWGPTIALGIGAAHDCRYPGRIPQGLTRFENPRRKYQSVHCSESNAAIRRSEERGELIRRVRFPEHTLERKSISEQIGFDYV